MAVTGVGIVPVGSDYCLVTDGAVDLDSMITIMFENSPSEASGGAINEWIAVGKGAFALHLTNPVQTETSFSYFVA